MIICFLCVFFFDRCQASAVAVSVAIAMMLQKDKKHLDMRGHYKVDKIIKDAYDIAVKYIVIEEQVGKLEHFSIIGILIRSCSYMQVNCSVFRVIFALCYFIFLCLFCQNCLCFYSK